MNLLQTDRRHDMTLLSCVLVAVTLGACSAGGDASGGDASDLGSIVMAMNEDTCDSFEAAAVIDEVEISFDPSPAPLEALRLSRTDIETHCVTPGSALAQFSDVPVGSYNASAQAFRSDDVVVGQGNEAFTVVHGETTQVTITLTPVDARGDVTVDIGFEGDWSDLEAD